jgi:hypothetical protein
MCLVIAVLASGSIAHAQPGAPPPELPPRPITPSEVLRDGNTAASSGDWVRVSALVAPLLQGQLSPADLAEAHRLAGLAAYFQGRKTPDAEEHFLAYLKIDLDARLDPSLYPPDVVFFFDEVKTKHAAELRKLRPTARRYWVLNLIPPAGQVQNGERTKGLVIGALLGGLLIGNVTSYLMLRSWCTRVTGSSGDSATCDDTKDRAGSAANLRIVNIATGVGFIVTYAYGVYDGVSRYRRPEVQPFVAPASGGGVVGISGRF